MHQFKLPLSVLLLTALIARAQDLFNATGSNSFPPPVYLNETTAPPANWTLQTAVSYSVNNKTARFTNSPFEHNFWIESPEDTVLIGSDSTDRDVCFIVFSIAYEITHSISGPGSDTNNGCDNAWGASCSQEIATALQLQFPIESNGTLKCSDQLIPDTEKLCGGKLKIGGWSSGNGSDLNQRLHGNFTQPLGPTIIQDVGTQSVDASYDSAVDSISSIFFITGPVIGSGMTQKTINMACVKPEISTQGSRAIPGAASKVLKMGAYGLVALFAMVFLVW